MTGRERFLAAISNKKADRMPCQVHSWMAYYLKTYLNGMDQYKAYDYFGMDPVIYADPKPVYSEKDLANWSVNYRELPENADGNTLWEEVITTPKGNLFRKGAYNKYTWWL